jgi:dimethylargininase
MTNPTTIRGTALVREPGPRLTEGLVTHIERRPVDLDLARRQHAGYVAALAANGWTTRPVEAADDCPDAVFVEDSVVVVDDLAVLTRPGAPSRRGELAGSESSVRELGLRVARIPAPGTLDGGDVLQVGRTVYVGRGGRTNDDGIRALARLLTPLGRKVVGIQLVGVLHLKSAVTALPDGSLIGLPDLLGEALDGSELPPVRVAPEEGGAHLVPLGGDTVLLAESAPATADLLVHLGCDVVSVQISEFEKLEGCVTCLSVLCPDIPSR